MAVYRALPYKLWSLTPWQAVNTPVVLKRNAHGPAHA
jgi:hypothetical protein